MAQQAAGLKLQISDRIHGFDVLRDTGEQYVFSEYKAEEDYFKHSLCLLHSSLVTIQFSVLPVYK